MSEPFEDADDQEIANLLQAHAENMNALIKEVRERDDLKLTLNVNTVPSLEHPVSFPKIEVEVFRSLNDG